ncbi:MAG: beta-ribofuranosylaminobenzene 5'-phosphate synthase [Methanospirillum sp.]
MTPPDLPGMIEAVERQLPRLSPLQKVLLLTDGSVTTLLEAASGERVDVRTIAQDIVPADAVQAERLECEIGDEVNRRVVNLIGARTGRVFVYAVSFTPLDRLMPGARDDLLAADIPIGRILLRHRMETRRELSEIGVVPAGGMLGRTFALAADAPVLCRRYTIVHGGKPLISIEERFPAAMWGDAVGVPAPAPMVVVEAPARLHLGLIDLHGGIGRIDGGIGITLMDPTLVLEAARSSTLTITGGGEEVRARVRDAARRVLDHLGGRGGAAIRIRKSISRHVGLGSGTQAALAAGAAISRLYGSTLTTRELARIVGRGGTSGIGTAAFESGGLVLDGGHSFGPFAEKREYRPSAASGGVPPAPVTARLPFPDDWRIVLAIPRGGRTVGGAREVDLFREHCPVPIDEVRQICHEVVMRLLPGVAGHDLEVFATAVNDLQGLGFKRVEVDLQEPVVRDLIAGLREAGAACAGLSSFGPTVYAVTDGDPGGIVRAAKALLVDGGGEIIVTRGRNYGAVF